jgi:hypothetical protein
MTSIEYRQSLDALPFGKRLPGAVYLIDPGDDQRIPVHLRSQVAPAPADRPPRAPSLSHQFRGSTKLVGITICRLGGDKNSYQPFPT